MSELREQWPKMLRRYHLFCRVVIILLALAAGMAWQADSWEMGLGVGIVAFWIFISSAQLRQKAEDLGLSWERLDSEE